MIVLKHQLACWLYKQLINKYTQAALTNSYHFFSLKIEHESGLLPQGKVHHNRAKIIEALKELKREKVIFNYTVSEKKQDYLIKDVVYNIIPSSNFVADYESSEIEDVCRKRKIETIIINYCIIGRRFS